MIGSAGRHIIQIIVSGICFLDQIVDFLPGFGITRQIVIDSLRIPRFAGLLRSRIHILDGNARQGAFGPGHAGIRGGIKRNRGGEGLIVCVRLSVVSNFPEALLHIQGNRLPVRHVDVHRIGGRKMGRRVRYRGGSGIDRIVIPCLAVQFYPFRSNGRNVIVPCRHGFLEPIGISIAVAVKGGNIGGDTIGIIGIVRGSRRGNVVICNVFGHRFPGRSVGGTLQDEGAHAGSCVGSGGNHVGRCRLIDTDLLAQPDRYLVALVLRRERQGVGFAGIIDYDGPVSRFRPTGGRVGDSGGIGGLLCGGRRHVRISVRHTGFGQLIGARRQIGERNLTIICYRGGKLLVCKADAFRSGP